MQTSFLPYLLLTAWLLPLAAFAVNLVAGRWLKKAGAWGVSIPAILGAAVCSYLSLAIWLYPGSHPSAPEAPGHASQASTAMVVRAQSPEAGHNADHSDADHSGHEAADHSHAAGGGHSDAHGHDAHGHGDHPVVPKRELSGVYYDLGHFGGMRLTISYYIDTLTIIMFCMVTLIASCIHFYAVGYMHDELHEVTDHEVTLSDGSHLKRPGRFARFFQYLSLFCFSMFGLVLAGNIAMVFCFWELVGICSYFLIGYYVERKSASTAANKAFIVNRVGDFGMIIGLMALWSALGTFSFGDVTRTDEAGHEVVTPGIFSQVRTAENGHLLISPYTDENGVSRGTPHTPAGFVRLGAQQEVADIVYHGVRAGQTHEQIEAEIESQIPIWRDPVKYRHELRGEIAVAQKQGNQAEVEQLQSVLAKSEKLGDSPYGYWLLIVAGLGIFCGCIGKSAQFPLHTWLPDAMEGPTPVSALVHSATMVAAGVYLVGRFYPVFTPEVLLVISIVGAITLFMAATIAIVATDIKRVLAYSTISQLGYMMLALGVGGWVAGLMHLVTHAFFKSLLFMCSGSVIHAVHTNEMPQMGGLLKKMPITAITMLIGCLAISGASIPFVIGLSGYYSKDKILEQLFWHAQSNESAYLAILFAVAAGGAAITAFYMFRLWFMTFMGKPRDHHAYDHAHESPRIMTAPLMILAFFAITVAWAGDWEWAGPLHDIALENLLEGARPPGTLADTPSVLGALSIVNEHGSHAAAVRIPVTLLAFGTAISGIALAACFYWLGYLDPADARRQFAPIYRFLWNKWYFDELYDFLFVRPTQVIGGLASRFDRRCIDGFIDGLARNTRRFSEGWEFFADRGVVDGTANLIARWTYDTGLALRNVQTGRLRQYVMFIVVGVVAVFLLISFFWSSSLAR
ncbi:NADH-quinone oxidoreductase subunit 5 family protein [Lignipirellula cremea]|uniref:NADH-quinone oxidoreductase subunit L n=1 Tax=Lignipirellula cremea TaxID=2528010 RepID=A0A518DU99_9BACT|nr:NADH-quinone oxidoreductase subunit L [Lignipirellula cremea]QDU95406.1 NADH-quinone oxidoreductase subunit L [Lignipirellula cremea]